MCGVTGTENLTPSAAAASTASFSQVLTVRSVISQKRALSVLPQRRGCRLTGLSRSTCRYEAQRRAADAHLSGRIKELALERRRCGYRRI